MPLKMYADEAPSLNLLPMIDVMFNLVLFLVLGAQFTSLEVDQSVKVPEVRLDGARPMSEGPQKKIVNVHRDGRITLNNKAVSLAQLQGELQGARTQFPALGVVVRGDGEGTWKNVATVLNAVRTAGITDIRTSVRLDDQSR